MDKFTLKRLAELMDDDAIDLCDFTLEDLELFETDLETFKRKYKEFHTDIKISPKEDW